ncbi:MAG: PAS domain S-box protein [Betaproteobacteria bacterium]|nr:PAS domain S-box protein [Betaproteobacteria bacterium]
MVAYDSMSRADLIATLRSLEGRLAAAASSARNPHVDSAKFPVFGEREQREFEKSPWPIRIFDRKTLKYLAVNAAALALYGYTREEFLSLTPLATRHPDERSEFFASLREPTGYLRHLGPRRHVKKSGDIIILEIIIQDVIYGGREARLSLAMDVTARVRMEETLRRREREFSALAENAPDIIARFDRDLRFVYVNPAVSAAMGVPRKAFIGKTSGEVGVPDSLAEVWEREVRLVFETGEERAAEFDCPCRDEPRHFEARMVPESHSDGLVETVIAIARDITGRKQAEDELKRQKKLLDAIIEHLPVGVTVKNANTRRYVLRNRMSEKLTGWSNAEAIGRRADEVYPPELAEILDASDREALARGSAALVPPEVLRWRTGRIVRNIKVPVPDENGHYTHLVSLIEDLTDIEETQAALRRSEHRLKQLIAMSPAAIFSFSLAPPLAVTYISENVTAQLGWSPSDFTSDPSFWRDRVHPEDRAAALSAAARVVTEGNYLCEYRFRHKDGSWRWVHDEGRLVRDAGGAPREGIGIWMDVTARREEAEERMRRAIRQRDALVREVHHRIKNNLQGVVGLLRQLAGENPEMRALVDKAVSQLQAVSVVHGLQGRKLHDGILLREMVPAIGKAVAEITHVPLRVEIAAETNRRVWIIENDAVPIALALNEVMLNAAKCTAALLEPDEVRVRLSLTAESARIAVSNTGALPRGFDFARGRGMGTGLELVRSLLPQSGVTLAFSQLDGRVLTTLEIRAPLVARHAAPAAQV